MQTSLTNKTNFSERLTQLINYKGYKNPNEFGKALGYKSSEKIFRLIRDKTNKPSIDILMDISNMFDDININYMLTGNGNLLLSPNLSPIYKKSIESEKNKGNLKGNLNGNLNTENINLVEENYSNKESLHLKTDDPAETYIKGTNIQVRTIAVAVDEKNHEVIKMVPVFAHAGYLNGFSDPEYIRDLPTISITNLLPPGSYRAFEVRGDSMVDTFLPGDRVAGRFVQNLTAISNYSTYIIITVDEIVLKRCVYRPDDRTMELHYDNPAYSAYSPELLPLTRIREMWKIELRIQTSIPAPNKVNSRIDELERELKRLKNNT